MAARPRESAQIGAFQRQEEIGRGSFATVYKALHTDAQHRQSLVAIKSVTLAKLNKKLKDNLTSEIHILKGLHHPHIVALVDCKESASHIHLIMEYVALGDLSQFIKKRDSVAASPMVAGMMDKYPNPRVGGLHEVVVRHFLQQLASALAFLRARNLIHRDVKPQNLLLSPSPLFFEAGHSGLLPYCATADALTPVAGVRSLPMLKIADFGFARALPPTSLAETLCGSPLYMAPEILRYEKYDAKADLWSVGTVVYEMVTGRPPFRASNHVELLRRIEKSEDKIKFGDEIHISRPVKELVRALLKRDPRQRISFEDLFAHSIVAGPIPGLVAEDRPGAQQSTATSTPNDQFNRPKTESTSGSRSRAVSVSEDGPHPAATPNPLRRQSTTNTAPPNPLRRQSTTVTTSNAGTHTRKYSRASPSPPLAPTAMARQNSAGTTTVRPPSSLRNEINDDREHRQRQEQTAHDIAFERDYVVVEKKAVEVNALADELDASPRFSRGLTHLTQSPKSSPARTGSAPVSAAGVNTGAQASAVRAVHMAAGRPLQQQGQQQHHRQHSYERRYGPSPTSATSAISKALNMASGRLFGIGISPPVTLMRTGDRQPQLYGPFPPYPGSNSSLVLVGEPPKAALDEDSVFVQHVEEIATRSDVVYGFAEVKYKQLIPATPSANQASLGLRSHAVDLASDTDADDMTVEATVTVAQEALVLYLKSLALMAKGMAVAARWWAKKDRRTGSDSLAKTPTQNNVAASQRMNAVVQWIRGRFNEVLEKSEVVRMKLIDNQRRLPEDHPSHPNNISAATASTGSNAIASADPIVITPGITAEKLMYDRALEMSRSAAINELTGDDLPGCEISYVTAIRMLEAVLESDQDSADEPDKDAKDDDDAPINGLEAEDRKTLKNLVLGIRQRLTSLRRKLQVMQKRASAPPLASPVRVSPPAASYRPSSRAAAVAASPR
ncbi:hypothetical protein DV735_g2942, partial [Chaetothyriales sp. CBS 134920]